MRATCSDNRLIAAPARLEGLKAAVEAAQGRCLILFSLAGCDACVMFKAALAEAELPDAMAPVLLVEADADTTDFRALSAAYKVEDFPSLVWMRDGAPYDVWAGFFADPDPAERRRLLNAELSTAAAAAGEAGAKT
ncbi:MAG: hypothetical protein RIA71_12725 [Oceanicaulis sp.]